MNIAIINTLYWPFKVGGAEVSVQILAESLSREGHQVSIITLTNRNHKNITNHNGVTIYQLPLRNIYWPFSGEKRSTPQKILWHAIDNYNFLSKQDISSILKEVAPDVVHTNNLAGFSVSAWDAANNLNIPIVHTSRDYYLINPNTTLHNKKGQQSAKSFSCKLWSLVKKIKSRKVGRYISISAHVQSVHSTANFFNSTPHEVIYNSIISKDGIEQQKKETPENPEDFTFGYIGRLTDAKGLNILIESFAKAGNLKLLIAGTGDNEYVEQLKKASVNSSIVFTGHVDPAAFFPLIDCLIVPSIWAEPLGRVVLESYSYGTPVIGTKSGGIPEIIKSGLTGFLCNHITAESLLESVNTILSADINTLKSNCITYSSEFSEIKISEAYEHAYKKAIKDHKLPNGNCFDIGE